MILHSVGAGWIDYTGWEAHADWHFLGLWAYEVTHAKIHEH